MRRRSSAASQHQRVNALRLDGQRVMRGDDGDASFGAMRFDQPTARDGYKAYVASLPDDGRVGEKGFELLVAQMFDEGTIKRRLAMTDLIDYRYIHEAQKK